jgi:hypothetical protein
MGSSTLEIVDGLLPNRYWVSISDNYYYLNNEAGEFNSIGNLKLVPIKTRMVKTFPAYDTAKYWAEHNLYPGMHYAGIKVNCVTIEDQLSGELFYVTRELSSDDGEVYNYREHADLRFTVEEMAAAGINFN